MKKFGQLKQLNLRDIWAKEASEFTPWLSENIKALGEALGLELVLEDREASSGDFSLDLLAKDLGSSRTVIIENQLTQTDHDHLGKLLTYAAGFNASIVVWLAESIREEHRQALDWLNQRTDTETEFFAVVVEVLQIDDSAPAYTFRPIVFPNEWQKSRRSTTRTAISSRGEEYRAYFQELIDDLREKHKFTGARVGQPQNWYSFSSGFNGVVFSNVFAQGGIVRAEIYIDLGDYERNKNLFDSLRINKDSIESEFGQNMEWERLDERRGSRIAIYRGGSIDSEPEELTEIRQWSIDNLLKIKKVFSPRLKKYFKS